MRLDVYLVENKYFDSRTKAQQAICRSEVFINGRIANKVSANINEKEEIKVEIIAENSFVSLGGFKLNKALNDFQLSVKDLTAADIGASTGGFTDCLLQRGAKKVFAVDLNDGLLHEKLRSDGRVISIIKNARELSKSDFNKPLDLIVADLSFISATYVLNVFSQLIDDGKQIILLIKPQFETGERKKFKNGIIRDDNVRREACQKIFYECIKCNLIPINFTCAPKSEDKNIEFLLHLEKNSNKKPLDITSLDYS